MTKDSISDALQRLSAANPIPRINRDELLLDLERSGTTARVFAADRGDNLRRRGPRMRLGYRLAIVGGLLLFVVIPSALALIGGGYPFLSGGEADAPVEAEVQAFASGAPPGEDVGIIADGARTFEVPIANRENARRTQRLWLAPTKGGGFCYGWVGISGGCDRFGTVPLSVTRATNRKSEFISGFVHRRFVARVNIRAADGRELSLPLLWIGAPINAGFFYYAGPPAQPVIARAEDGAVVTSDDPSRSRVTLPPDAITAKRQALATTTTGSGTASLWMAPTRYGGRCAWISLGGTARPVGACKPDRYPPEPFALQVLRTPKAVVVGGIAAERFESVSMEYVDGTTDKLRLRNGVFIVSIPDTRWEHNREARAVIGFDAAGQATFRFEFAKAGACFAPQPGLPC